MLRENITFYKLIGIILLEKQFYCEKITCCSNVMMEVIYKKTEEEL